MSVKTPAFPDYKKILPGKPTTSISVSWKAIQSAIRLIRPSLDLDEYYGQIVSFNVDSNGSTLKIAGVTLNEHATESEVEVPVESKGPAISFMVNVGELDKLKTSPKSQVSINFTKPNKPVEFVADGLQFVVMVAKEL